MAAHTCTLFGRPRQEDHLNPGVQDQPEQQGKNLSLLKIQKISQAWWRVLVVPATWEAEVAVSQDRTTDSSLGDTVRLHLKNNNKAKYKIRPP